MNEIAWPLVTALTLCMVGKAICDAIGAPFAETAIGALVFWQAQQWWRRK